MDRDLIIERLREISSDVANQMGLEFVHAELAGTKRNLTVRIYFDKPGGVTVDECGEASREIGQVLDIIDIIPDSYVLEVSSPGVERELYSLGDFQRFLQRKVRVKTVAEIDGRKVFRGMLSAVENDTVVISEDNGAAIRIPYSAVAKANLVFNVMEDLGRTPKP